MAEENTVLSLMEVMDDDANTKFHDSSEDGPALVEEETDGCENSYLSSEQKLSASESTHFETEKETKLETSRNLQPFSHVSVEDLKSALTILENHFDGLNEDLSKEDLDHQYQLLCSGLIHGSENDQLDIQIVNGLYTYIHHFDINMQHFAVNALIQAFEGPHTHIQFYIAKLLVDLFHKLSDSDARDKLFSPLLRQLLVAPENAEIWEFLINAFCAFATCNPSGVANRFIFLAKDNLHSEKILLLAEKWLQVGADCDMTPSMCANTYACFKQFQKNLSAETDEALLNIVSQLMELWVAKSGRTTEQLEDECLAANNDAHLMGLSDLGDQLDVGHDSDEEGEIEEDEIPFDRIPDTHPCSCAIEILNLAPSVDATQMKTLVQRYGDVVSVEAGHDRPMQVVFSAMSAAMEAKSNLDGKRIGNRRIQVVFIPEPFTNNRRANASRGTADNYGAFIPPPYMNSTTFTHSMPALPTRPSLLIHPSMNVAGNVAAPHVVCPPPPPGKGKAVLRPNPHTSHPAVGSEHNEDRDLVGSFAVDVITNSREKIPLEERLECPVSHWDPYQTIEEQMADYQILQSRFGYTNRYILLSNLPALIETAQDVRAWVDKFVEDQEIEVEMIQSQDGLPLAHLTFKTKREASDAFKKLFTNHVGITCEHAPPRKPNTCLWLGNVRDFMCKDPFVKDFRNMFEQFGTVVRFKLMAEKSCGFVSYRTVDEAIAARNHLYGVLFGREICLNIDFSPAEQQPMHDTSHHNDHILQHHQGCNMDLLRNYSDSGNSRNRVPPPPLPSGHGVPTNHRYSQDYRSLLEMRERSRLDGMMSRDPLRDPVLGLLLDPVLMDLARERLLAGLSRRRRSRSISRERGDRDSSPYERHKHRRSRRSYSHERGRSFRSASRDKMHEEHRDRGSKYRKTLANSRSRRTSVGTEESLKRSSHSSEHHGGSRGRTKMRTRPHTSSSTKNQLRHSSTEAEADEKLAKNWENETELLKSDETADAPIAKKMRRKASQSPEKRQNVDVDIKQTRKSDDSTENFTKSEVAEISSPPHKAKLKSAEKGKMLMVCKVLKQGQEMCKMSAKFVSGDSSVKLTPTLDVNQRANMERLQSHLKKTTCHSLWQLGADTRHDSRHYDELCDYFINKDRAGLVETAGEVVYMVPPNPKYMKPLDLPDANFMYAFVIPKSG